MRRALVLVVVLVGLAIVAAAPSGAKDGVEARIATPIPREVAPGSKVVVVWTLSFVDAGRRAPFSADAVFVRLFGPNGSRSARAYAIQPEPGRYRARARIPQGGVRRVVIGLMGTGCDANGCRPSPALFEIVGRALR